MSTIRTIFYRINSTVGSGHLNKYGHEMIADELYKIISCSEDK